MKNEAFYIPAQYIGMKIRFFSGIARYFITALLVFFTACESGPILSSYRLVLPELPVHWKEILGEPHWRLEWIGGEGFWLEWEGAGQPPELSPIQEWTSPVLAWPFWPAWDLPPGLMRPAGALFPWDVSGGKLLSSWKGGADAVFWKELALAERSTAAAAGRLPWYFDWPRFRELLRDGNVPEPVRRDPWLADWKYIAERTVRSGFDRRRIVSRTFTGLSIPGLGGRWIGSSPFALPLDAPTEGPLVLSVSAAADTWVSPGGVLKCSSSGWVWRGR